MVFLNADFTSVLPVFFIVLLGFLSRKYGFVDKEFGKKLLVFTLLIPISATAFLTLSQIRFSTQDLLLPFAAVFFIFFMFLYGSAASPKLGLKKPQDGVFRISLMILNTAFVLIFAIPMLGAEGAQKVFLIDVADAILIYSFVYYVALKSSSQSPKTSGEVLKKIFSFPPLLASLAGLAVALMRFNVPALAVSVLSPLNLLSFPLLAFSTGVFLELKSYDRKVLSFTVLSKMALGLALGIAFAWLFNMQGFAKLAVLACFSSPTGFNSVAFAAKEKLDVEMAASLFFVSAVIGLLLVPAIFLFA